MSSSIIANSSLFPQIYIPDNSLGALKWLAAALMVIDHTNKYLFQGSVAAAYNAGRIAMPLFAFVLAYNLARPNALARGAYRRTLCRLAAFGMLASIPYIGLGAVVGGWWPLNILCTFFVALAVRWLWELNTPPSRLVAGVTFVAGGGLVEFWWPAIALFLACHFHARTQSWGSLFRIAATLVLMSPINGNHWALSMLPIVVLASRIPMPPLPRYKVAFYVLYPGHLFALWGLLSFK